MTSRPNFFFYTTCFHLLCYEWLLSLPSSFLSFHVTHSVTLDSGVQWQFYIHFFIKVIYMFYAFNILFIHLNG